MDSLPVIAAPASAPSRLPALPSRRRRRLLLAASLLALGACTQLPKPQLQAYTGAFQAAHTAAEPVLETYAVQERAAWREKLAKERNFDTYRYFDTFEPGDAAAVSALTLPIGAAAANRAFDGIAEYNDVLVSLAENKNVDEARGQLKEIVSNVTALAQPLAAAAPAIQSAAGLLVTALEPAIREDNKRQFRRIVLDGHDEVEGLIHAIRGLTPAQYQLITGPLQARWVDATPKERETIAKEINGWHTVFADYVVLLDAMESKLDALHSAVENPKATPILAQAVAGSAELRAYADGLRRSIAELQAPK